MLSHCFITSYVKSEDVNQIATEVLNTYGIRFRKIEPSSLSNGIIYWHWESSKAKESTIKGYLAGFDRALQFVKLDFVSPYLA
jgi:hypothetical protein